MTGIIPNDPRVHPKLDAENRLVVQVFMPETGQSRDHVVPDSALPYWAKKIADAILYRCQTSCP
jgi:hypothetical protein